MYEIIKLCPDDSRINEALTLAAEVFTEFEAPLYSKEGAESFFAFLNGENLRRKLSDGSAVIYIYEDDGIRGMMAVRDGSHICLAFVEREYQRRGVGRALFDCILSDYPNANITVNAAPTGYEFYKRLGFMPADMELVEDGIIYTPMIRTNCK